MLSKDLRYSAIPASQEREDVDPPAPVIPCAGGKFLDCRPDWTVREPKVSKKPGRGRVNVNVAKLVSMLAPPDRELTAGEERARLQAKGYSPDAARMLTERVQGMHAYPKPGERMVRPRVKGVSPTVFGSARASRPPTKIGATAAALAHDGTLKHRVPDLQSPKPGELKLPEPWRA